MIYTLYLITNSVNGKVYVGYTGKTAQKRFALHLRDARAKRSWNRAIYRAIRKHGDRSFSVLVLEQVDSLEMAKVREMHYISTYCSTDQKCGYNMTLGGDGTPSEDTKKKISAANTGKRMSDEFRRKCSAAKSGPRHPLWGKKMPVEVAAKIGMAHIGRWVGPKHPAWREIPVNQVVDLYRFGISTHGIGKLFEVDHTTIMDRLKMAGVCLRGRHGRRN